VYIILAIHLSNEEGNRLTGDCTRILVTIRGDNKQMRAMIAGTLIIGMSISFLLHFALIGFYKSILIQESNTWLFWIEVTVFVAILAYGIYIVWRELSR
jgi:hypothetical protein